MQMKIFSTTANEVLLEYALFDYKLQKFNPTLQERATWVKNWTWYPIMRTCGGKKRIARFGGGKNPGRIITCGRKLKQTQHITSTRIHRNVTIQTYDEICHSNMSSTHAENN